MNITNILVTNSGNTMNKSNLVITDKKCLYRVDLKKYGVNFYRIGRSK